MKLTKRIFAIVLSCLVLAGATQVAFAADVPLISVETVTAKPGEDVEVSISVSNNPGIISMLIHVQFDDALTLKKVENGNFLTDAFHDVNDLSKNPYILSWGDDVAPENNTTNGEIVTFTFRVADNAPNGKLPVKVFYDNKDAAIYNYDLEEVDFDIENGGVMVEGAIADGGNSDGENSDSGNSDGGNSKPADKDKEEVKPPVEDDEIVISPAPQTSKFGDVKAGDWFFENVSKAVELGLMNGISETEFAPQSAVTRGMFVTVLHRMSGDTQETGGAAFEDVKGDEYYAIPVAWAKKSGIVSGVTETTFAPNSQITREQMATMLYRYAKFVGAVTEENESVLPFGDADKISEYAVDGVQWACGSKIMNGNPDGTFAPVNNATRAELATVLVRAVDVLK